MQNCFQFRELSVLGHGDEVLKAYLKLLEAAKAGGYPTGWRQPKWWASEVAQQLAREQPTVDCMHRYLRYHDCGKPLCRTVDDQGRQHFPEHAEISARLWSAAGGTDDEIWLMRHDMLLHAGSAESCAAHKGHRLVPALIFSALAEVHANAVMFGGVESDSFKSKFKHIERRSAAMLKP